MLIIVVVFRHLNSTCDKIKVLQQFCSQRLSVYGNSERHKTNKLNQPLLLYTYTSQTDKRWSGTRHSYPTPTLLSLTARLQRHRSVQLPHPGDARFSPSSHHTFVEKPAGHHRGSFLMAQAACTRQSLFSWLAAKELAGRTSLCEKAGKEFQRGRTTGETCLHSLQSRKRKKEGNSSVQAALRCSNLNMMLRVLIFFPN